ncbi:Geranyltranstransferase [Deinococcus proteolyticus MRP]|uniref:Geranyltranstransferase n=2 Tax=Deinococcus TaxID=1298 RepID=F0RNE7_DEIPM|nr:polyprenyl synthetase family protein [Deinococcus proteolyticus]ADY25249.1 Geranyltranstransferase [Deinococcus proteolyticus MRP]
MNQPSVPPRPAAPVASAASADSLSAGLPPAFEQRLREVLRSEVEFIELIGEDLVAAGGKRLRPLVTLLSAQALQVGAPEDAGGHHGDALALAICIELLHSASLLHDDLIDDADTRRGQEAAFRRYGNVVSVMSGDFMLARLLMLLSELPAAARLTRAFGEVASVICEGEVLQFQVAAYGNPTPEQYSRIIYGKTAALLELAAAAPALLLGASAAQEQALRQYGRELGMAFQIRDDLLDLLGREEDLGKPVGSDLREGKATFAVLQLLDTPAGEEVRAILLRRAAHGGDLARVQALCAEYGAAEAGWREVARRLELARAALLDLPASPARQELETLLDRLALPV